MSSLYAMQRANGDWFALDDNGGFRVPVFHSDRHAMTARSRDSGMECFRPAVFDEKAIKDLTMGDGGPVCFWLVDNPTLKLSRGRPLDHAQLSLLLQQVANQPGEVEAAP